MNHKRNMKKIVSVIVITTPLFLSACGGGGGSSSTTTPTPTPTPTSTSAPTPAPTPTATPGQPTAQSINTFTIPTVGVRTSANLSTTASSGLPVSYVTTTPTICSISGSTVTGLSLGTCSITASQSGNTSFSAAQAVSESVVIGAQTINLTIPALTIGEAFPVTSTATSGFPITLTSQTTSVCTVSGMVLNVVSAVPGSCIITATQAGNSQYSAATPVSVIVAIDAANQLVATGATPPPIMFPEIGSMKADSTTTFEGIYQDAEGLAFIDSANNIEYYDAFASLFGSLQITGSAWTLNPSSISYSNLISNNRTSAATTGTGTFVLKQSFSATTQSFSTFPSPLSLTYDPANGFAVTQSSISGNWLLNTGTEQYRFAINSVGVVTGTYTNTSGNFCAISGALLLADSNTSHNLYNASLSASTVSSSGASCNIDSNFLQGLSAIRFLSATSNSANGIFPAISLIVHATDGARIFFSLYKQS